MLVSNVSLNATTGGKSSLFVKVGNHENILVTSLEPGKHEHAQVHLYLRISDGVTFTVQGSGEVHIAGYYDLEEGGLEDDDELDEEEFAALKKQQKKLQKEVDEEEDDEDELDEEDLAPAKPQKQVKTDQKPVIAPVKQQKAAEVQKAAQPQKAAAAPAKAPAAPVKAPAATKGLDELDDEDLENMTESEIAALEAELEGEDGLEELDEEDLEGLEDDDLDGLDEEGLEEDDEEEAPAQKSIPNVIIG